MPQFIDTTLKFPIDLDCGRRITVASIICEQTYGFLTYGVMEGVRITKKLNDGLIKDAPAWVNRHWGHGDDKPKVHVIAPVIDEKTYGFPMLPRAQFAACLTCDEPVKDQECFWSSLVVVWFQNDFAKLPLEQVVRDAVRGLPWDELAEDF